MASLLGFTTRSHTNCAVQHRRWQETLNFGFKKERDCTIYAFVFTTLSKMQVFSCLLLPLEAAEFGLCLGQKQAHMNIYEPRREKTGFLNMRKQRRRSASQ